MTGIPNVNNVLMIYRLTTLVFLCFFAIYDKRHHKIRNTALLAFLPWCLFSIPVTAFQYPAVPWFSILLRSLLGCISGFCTLLFTSILTDGSIGGGDIKLTGLLGILYGTTGLLFVLFLTCMTALLHNGIKALPKGSLPKNIALAPYLFYGCALYTLFHQTI